jgi:galactitol PTS system EIIA component
MFALALSVARLEARSAADVIVALASRLASAGHVKEKFQRAALSREKKSPTGLPFSPWAVALPHADPEHATSPAIAVATLAKPVMFRQMGSPDVKLDVSIVVMPAFTAKEQAASSLSRLIGLLQRDEIRERLVSAASPEDILAVMSQHENEA